MKTTFETNQLLPLLKSTKCFKNRVLPSLDFFRIKIKDGVAEVTLTNLETSITKRFPADGELDICLPREVLTKHLDKSKTITIESASDGTRATVNGLTLSLWDVEDFPVSPAEIDTEKGILFKGGLMLEVKAAIPFLSNDELRIKLMGVNLTNSNGFNDVAATNSHVLFRSRHGKVNKKDTKYDYIFRPIDLIKILDGLKLTKEDVVLTMNESHLQINYEDVVIQVQLIQEKFPLVENVIPKENPIQALFDLNELVDAINFVKVAANKTTRQIKFVFNKNRMVVSASDYDMEMHLEKEVECNYKEDFEVGFNYTFLLSMLASCQEKQITFEMSSPVRACLINSKERLLLTMPVMLTN
jgi:DNA polymerase III sliding clamp (beta) subunit (PCNA family)